MDTNRERIRAALLFLLTSSTFFFACATAVDDPGLELKPRDGGRDVGSSVEGGEDSGVTTGTDSGRGGTDTGTSFDSHVPPTDSGTTFDTYVPPPTDTGTGFDTYVPPPTDTGTGGGAPCLYCLGTCTDEIADETCFIDCIGGGASDCSMSGTTCTCIP